MIKKNQIRGFTILELLVVLAVIGVFAGIAYPNISNWITDRNVKKEVYEKHGKFNLNFKISADYDFMLRVFKDESLKLHYMPGVITRMRVGGVSNKNLKNILLKTYEDYKAIRKNKIGSIGTLVRKNTSKIKQFF